MSQSLEQLVGSIDGKLDILIKLHHESNQRINGHDDDIGELKTRVTVVEAKQEAHDASRKDNRSLFFSIASMLIALAALAKGLVFGK